MKKYIIVVCVLMSSCSFINFRGRRATPDKWNQCKRSYTPPVIDTAALGVSLLTTGVSGGYAAAKGSSLTTKEKDTARNTALGGLILSAVFIPSMIRGYVHAVNCNKYYDEKSKNASTTKRYLADFMNKTRSTDEFKRLLAIDNSSLGNKHKLEAAGKKISIGMSEEAVRLSWGSPSKINVSTRQSGKHQQFVYRKENHRSDYVYIDNGVVISIQTH